MERSWLVQRLKKPLSGQMGAFAEAFSFGGGMRNGGLSDDAMTLLREVFAFDYMGSAEFEWGAVPNALQRIAQHQSELTSFTLQVPLSMVPPHWRANQDEIPDGTASVYVLCRAPQAEQVKERIFTWAAAGYQTDTKESVQLSAALRPFHDWDTRTCGWLELDNGFFFFTEEHMWRSTAALFGVEVAS